MRVMDKLQALPISLAATLQHLIYFAAFSLKQRLKYIKTERYQVVN
jgi:hypothetical protein